MKEESAFKEKRITSTGFGLKQVYEEAISTRYKWYYFAAKPNQREKYCETFWRQGVRCTVRTETTQKFLLTLRDLSYSIQAVGIKEKN